MKTILVAGLILAAMSCAPEAGGRSILRRKPAEISPSSQNFVFLYERTMAVERAYRVGISHEWHPALNRIGNYERDLQPVGIHRRMPLAEALDRVISGVEDRLEWRLIHGSVCLLPKGVPPTTMDLPISYSVENVSAWEALRELVHTVNEEVRRGAPGRYLRLDLSCLGLFVRPPATFTEVRGITLVLEDTPVREVLCAIFRASAVDMRYRYAEYVDRTSFTIGFCGKDTLNRLAEPDLDIRYPVIMWWSRELEKLRPDFSPPYRKIETLLADQFGLRHIYPRNLLQ